MNPSPFAVSPNTHVSQVFNLFRTMGLRHLPVVNAVGEVSPYLHFVLAEQGSQCGFLQCLNSNRNALKRSEWDLLKAPKHCWLLWLLSFVSKPASCFPCKGQDMQSLHCLKFAACGSPYCLVPLERPWAHQRLLIWLPLWQLYARPRAEFPVCWGRRFFCWKGTCILFLLIGAAK